MTIFDKIIKFEQEGLPFEEEINLFQELVNNGMAWTLQGMYGRIAKDLIEQGFIHLPKRKT